MPSSRSRPKSLAVKRQLIVCDDEEVVHLLLRRELRQGWAVTSTFSGDELCRHLRQAPASLVLLDLRLAGSEHGFEVLSHLGQHHADCRVIVYSSDADHTSVVRAMQLGAVDYLPKAAGIATLRKKLEKWWQLGRGHCLSDMAAPVFIEESQAARVCMAGVRRAATSRGHALVVGETGAGKQVIVRALHHDRGPFVYVDAVSLTAADGEERLFGGTARAQGLWQQARGGSLCIDEVAELPRHLQARLSRLIDQQSARDLPRDDDTCVRVICTSRHDLSLDKKRVGFREDLLGQLSVFLVRVPPLRQRTDDVGPLAAHFVSRLGSAEKLPLSPSFIASLREHRWPGNVRQLCNAIQYALAFAGDEALSPHHLDGFLSSAGRTEDALTEDGSGSDLWGSSRAAPSHRPAEIGNSYRSRLRALEAELLQAELRRADFNIAKMAREVGMSRTYLYDKLRRLGLLGSRGRT